VHKRDVKSEFIHARELRFLMTLANVANAFV